MFVQALQQLDTTLTILNALYIGYWQQDKPKETINWQSCKKKKALQGEYNNYLGLSYQNCTHQITQTIQLCILRVMENRYWRFSHWHFCFLCIFDVSMAYRRPPSYYILCAWILHTTFSVPILLTLMLPAISFISNLSFLKVL